MKNLFISIGSTSTTALATLIDRLIDLDIYKSDDSFKDMFVAIDTDAESLEVLKKFNDGNVAHTYTIDFKKSAGNVLTHNFLKKSFRKDWDARDMEIRASDHGVGGQRVKSFSSLEWKPRLEKLIDEFYRGVNNTLEDCQVILVASTWGGTATGMFQNVADFVGAKIFEECGNDQNKLSSFYIVLAMPDFGAAQKVFREKRYQGLANFVYMMRGIQQAGWRGTLNRASDAETEPNFIFPEFFDLPLNDDKSLPVSTIRERLCGTIQSPLPAKALIVIPALLPGTATTNTIAEELLLLVYVDILNRTLQPNGNANSKFIDLRTNDLENVVIGINMVECQLEYDAEIRKVVAQHLFDSWKNFSEDAGKDLNAKQFVRNFIAQAIRKPEDDRLQKTVLQLLDNLTSNDPKDIAALKNSVEEFQSAARNDVYDFVSFGNDLFQKMDAYAKTLPEKDLTRKAFYDDLVLKDVQAAYQEQISAWLEASKANVEEKVRQIKNMIDRILAVYQQFKFRSGRNSFIFKYCNGADAVSKEYIGIAKEEITHELLALQELMLVKATISKFQLDRSSAVSGGDWDRVTELLTEKRDECLNDDSRTKSNPGFIKKVADPRLLDLLEDPDVIRIKSSDLIDLMENANDEVKLTTSYNDVCSKFIKEVKMIVNDPNKSVKANDFSIVTLAGADHVQCCSPVYQLDTTKSAVPPYMFHFYAKCSGAGDITWEDVRNLGFHSFLLCKRSSIVESSKVSADHFDPSTLPGSGVWFENDVSYGKNKKLYGMWLGSVDLGMTLRGVLSSAYVESNLTDIQADAKDREEGGNGKVQCHQTLFEKIAIGAMLGILNDKLAKQTPGENQDLSVSIQIADDLKWSASCRVRDIAALGFQKDANGCVLKEVSTDLIREMMDWLRRDPNSGSCRFVDALGADVRKLFNDLMEQEHFVLQKISLGPDIEQDKLIKKLIAQLDPCITVSISGE